LLHPMPIDVNDRLAVSPRTGEVGLHQAGQVGVRLTAYAAYAARLSSHLGSAAEKTGFSAARPIVPPRPSREGRNHAAPPMIRINDRISIADDEIEENFIRSSGPGGQNVNKLSTAVQLRFDVRASPSLTDDVRARLERLAGRRLTRDGVLVITAQRYRTQERNRDDARARLIDLIRAAATAPVPRRPTRPTLGSKLRRLEGKSRRSGVKALRGTKPAEE